MRMARDVAALRCYERVASLLGEEAKAEVADDAKGDAAAVKGVTASRVSNSRIVCE